MFKFLLTVICLYHFPTDAFNNGRIVYGMEKKAMEKDMLVNKIFKRATNDNNLKDNDIPQNDITDIVTTHSPRNVLEYMTAGQQGHESSNVSVHQLENTTKSGVTNVSAVTDHHNVTSSPGILNTTTEGQASYVTRINSTSKLPVANLGQTTDMSPGSLNTSSLNVNITQITSILSTNVLSTVTPSGLTEAQTRPAPSTSDTSKISKTSSTFKPVTSNQTASTTSTHLSSSSFITTNFQKNQTSSAIPSTIVAFITTELSLGSNTSVSTNTITNASNELSTISSQIPSDRSTPFRKSQTSKSKVEITTTDLLSVNITQNGADNSSYSLNETNVTTKDILASNSPTQISAIVPSSQTAAPNITEQKTNLILPSTEQFVTSIGPSISTSVNSKSFSENSTQLTFTTSFATLTPKSMTSVTPSTDIPISDPEPTPTATGKVETSSKIQVNGSTTIPRLNQNSTGKGPGNITSTSRTTSPSTPHVTLTTRITTNQQRPVTRTTSKGIPTTPYSIVSPKSEPEDHTKETDNPTSEPETYTPTSEQGDAYPSSEPEDSTNGVEAEPGFNLDVFAEPGPDWPVAKVEWKQAWEFHVYFFGIAFVILGLYCLLCVVQLWKMDHLLSRHYFMTLQALVMLICLFRALYLLIDAYNSLGTFPIVLDYFLYSTVFPCLTAVFSILFYALLLAIRVRVMSEKIQKLWVLLVITGLHFALSFATDIVVGLFSTATVMLIICQSFFVFWGLIIFIGYLVIFKRVYKSAISRQEALRRSSTHERKNNITQGYQEKLPKQKYRLGLAVKVTLVSSFFGLACVCFELYGLFGVYGVMRTEKPRPWPWWIYHSVVRCLELAMCSSIAYVASQPLKYTYKKKYKDNTCLKALPCRYLCCADIGPHRDEVDLNMDQYAVSETDALGWLKKLRQKKFSSPDISAPYPPHTAEKYTDPDATLLVRKINKPKPSMLVVEDGFVRIRREDEMPAGNQYDLQSSSSSRSSDINNVNYLPGINNIVNENRRTDIGVSGSSGGVANAGFAQEDYRNSLQDEYNMNGQSNKRLTYQNDNRFSFHDELEHDADIADETDIDIAVTDCENSDGYETPIPDSDENSGASGDIFRPLSDIDLAASMKSELERAFHSGLGDESDTSLKLRRAKNGEKSQTKSNEETGYNGQCNTDDDWSDSSDGPSRTSEAGLLRRPIRRCKSAETKELQKSKMFDKNRYFSLSSIDSIGKQENHPFGSNTDSS